MAQQPANAFAVFQRQMLEQKFTIYQRIAMRKHNVAVMNVDLSELSDEQINEAVDMLKDIAHLPPV